MHTQNQPTRSTLLMVLVAMMVAIAIMPTSADAKTYSRTQVKKLVLKEAWKIGISPPLALAVARVSSNFRSNALGPEGGIGIMRIVPEMAETLYNVKREELQKTKRNIQVGLDHLDRLLKRHDDDLKDALTHYFSGSKTGDPPPASMVPATRSLVKSVIRWESRYGDQVWISHTDTGIHRWRRWNRTVARTVIPDDEFYMIFVEEGHPGRISRSDPRLFVGDDFSARFPHNGHAEDLDDDDGPRLRIRNARNRYSNHHRAWNRHYRPSRLFIGDDFDSWDGDHWDDDDDHDFDSTIELRRRRARHSLDDFTPVHRGYTPIHRW